jgi:hypothetical protein
MRFREFERVLLMQRIPADFHYYKAGYSFTNLNTPNDNLSEAIEKTAVFLKKELSSNIPAHVAANIDLYDVNLVKEELPEERKEYLGLSNQ